MQPRHSKVIDMSDPKKKTPSGLEDVTHEMENMFEEFTTRSRAAFARTWRPNTDVFESADEMIILVELAGVRKEEVQLTLQGSVLRLSGERKLFRNKADMAYRNMEVSFGPFERNIHLHESVDPESIQAFYRDGFLEIKILKRAPRSTETRQIEIETDE
jgi:HSP20 family protein